MRVTYRRLQRDLDLLAEVIRPLAYKRIASACGSLVVTRLFSVPASTAPATSTSVDHLAMLCSTH
jgi:hypothetical protein